jgi:type III pantothenate kinase
MKMNLIIDVGNTRVKIAVYKAYELIYNEVVTHQEFIQNSIKAYYKYSCKAAIISSVSNVDKDELVKLKTELNLIQLTNHTNIPFKNKYKTPSTLGVDRIALVAAAVLKYPNSNVLVIDAGTCITYDFVSDKKEYFGGSISPGLNMRFKAMHQFTGNLPLVELNDNVNLIGRTTEESMQSGAIFGIINEIDSFINIYKEKNKDLTVVLTGGDVNFLAKRLKNSIFANPNFLLDGLNTILLYNLK